MRPLLLPHGYMVSEMKKNARESFDDLSVNASLRAFSYDHDLIRINPGPCLFRGDELDISMTYVMIVRFLEAIERMSEAPFREVVNKKYIHWRARNSVSKYLPLLNSMVSSYRDDHQYFGMLNYFFYHSKEAGLLHDFSMKGELLSGRDKNKVFNDLCISIKKDLEGNRPGVDDYTAYRRSRRRYDAAVDYCKKILSLYASVLPVCIDLHYNKEGMKGIDQERVSLDRTDLLNRLKKDDLMKGMVGYLCKLEVGREAFVHMHFVFFIKQGKMKEASGLALVIGGYWIDVIGEDFGFYYDCHQKGSPFKYRTPGPISYRNNRSVKKLWSAIAYLTKTDQFVRCKSPVDLNGFTMGRVLAAKSVKRGRPRDSSLNGGAVKKTTFSIRVSEAV